MYEKPSRNVPSALRLLAVLSISAPFSQGALLVYEGFTGYNAGELNGQAASTQSIGLNGSWDGSSYGNRHQLTASGLTFSGLATSGGALTTGNDVRLSGIAMNHAGVAAGDTLYSSYLVSFSSATNSGSGLLTRINGTSATQASGYFNSFADSRSSNYAAVSYDSTLFNAANHTAESTAIPAGQTFIVISSFTNVGNAAGGTGSLYVLSQAQFLNLRTIGLSNLASLTVGQGATEAWATASATSAFNGSFDNADFLHILSLSSSGTIDELRYGTTLEAVLPVPEASTLALSGLAFAGLAIRRKRSRH
ncbi:PEP-CTERM sorting domain-containing protein [Luteolibacter sp. SL250]|uniref:PEP-CTERM sorting domain-containing protein n=1 Tax=Luteolibacter sp. SL250 TaxID=2995170 RepID=UPI00227193C4|nr:PEP-CTERM sorting domain-containing protein [Luteolibacter sp. SL250]WAC21502.1 PEP-CTERM sorting domain-containing protein [Luteolibacter sp. SL250]